MKLMDNNGRLFGKLSIIDLAIIVVLIGAIVGIALRGATEKDSAPEYQKGICVYQIEAAPEYMADAYEEGDILYEAGYALGKITKVEVEPRMASVVLNNGQTVLRKLNLSKTITLTVETDQLETTEGIRINTREMLNGTGHTISNGFATSSAVVMEIKPIE